MLSAASLRLRCTHTSWQPAGVGIRRPPAVLRAAMHSLHQWPQAAVWLCLIVCALRSSGCCAVHGPYTPSSLFPSTACSLTFRSFDAAFLGKPWSSWPNDSVSYTIPLLPFQSIAALCPSDCVGAADSGRVYGSYPYAPQSSICLAAIHSGVISNREGGGVFVSRFYRQDWSNSSTQTIFPYSSSSGSLSNGVQSEAVDSSWYTVPSSANEWSYVARGRGDRILQRRMAPFPPRAGHLQLEWQWTAPPGRADSGTLYLLHLVAAGYNATHYLNDVWLGVQRGRVSPSDVSWSRQTEAPFTPRSHVQVRAALDLLADPVVYVVGGQTNHSCGLRELGVCSGEVWRFRLTPDDSQPEPTWQVTWDPQPLLHLPFTPRCQPAMLVSQFIRLNGPPVEGLTFVGGQLSFDASLPCSHQPQTVSELWFGNFTLDAASQARWWRLPDVPFSPRRFEWSSPMPYRWTQTVGGTNRYGSGDYRGTLIGGLRHVSTSLAPSGIAQLNVTEITAEIWRCIVGGGQGPDAPPFPYIWRDSPVAAMAAPTAAWADQMNNYVMYDLSFGGITSDGFIRAWRDALPPLDTDIRTNYRELAINITMVRSLDFQRDPTGTDLLPLRAGLPLNLTMHAAELADPNGNYALGSEWTQGLPIGVLGPVAASTFHHQPFAFATQPSQASWFVPQAGSSTNTTRPLLNFSLRRHSHRYARFINANHFSCDWTSPCYVDYILGVSSGGRSGNEFYNDWILTNQGRCLPPVDPSFHSVLGPIEIVSMSGYNGREFNYTGTVLTDLITYDGIRIACPHGHHLEPPKMDRRASLSCMPNGMWMDVEALTIRRCVLNVLNCSWPLDDVGGLDCEPAVPIIGRLSAAFADASGQWQSLSNRDAVTVVDVPVGAAIQLTIDGNVFVHPVAVTVNGKQCNELTLVPPSDSPGIVCYNVSSADDGAPNAGVQRMCDPYGSRIICTLPPMLGRSMAVTVSSGRLGAIAEINPDVGPAMATLTSIAPVLINISSPYGDCQQDESLPLQLSGCPVNHSFYVEVCAQAISVGAGQGVVAVMSSSSFSRPFTCYGWRSSGSLRCSTCRVLPQLSTARIFLRQFGFDLDGRTQALLSFQQCLAGTSTDLAAALLGTATDLCSPCPAGWSTNGNVGQRACIACPAGSYSETSGAAICSMCPAGSYAESSNSTGCLPCSPNSLSRDRGQTRCNACELNQYIVYAPQQALVAGDCLDCPAMARCDRLGNITAQAGAYVLIDQTAGTLTTATCWSSDCLDGQQCAASAAAPASAVQRVSASNLTVINCCGAGAWPAYVPDPELYRMSAVMQAAGGHNVLCASCLPGFAAVNGRCIECGSTRAGPLCGVLLLALCLVYLVHRLPHDWTGSAALLITSYFVQMSALFQATEALPQLASLVNVNLLGSHVSRGQDAATDMSQRTSGYAGVCIAPLSDVGRLIIALLSPLIAFALLGVVAALQYVARAALSWSQVPPSAAAHRAYRWLFAPSPPRLLEPGARPRASHHSTLSNSLLHEPSTATLDDSSASPSDSAVELQQAERGCLLPLSYQRTCVRLVQLSYCGLTVATLSFFHLQSVGEFGWRVVEYPTLSPQSAEYRTVLPFVASVLAIVVCGLPLALTAFLLIEHRRGSIAVVKLQQSAGRVILNRKALLLLQLCAAFGAQYWWMAPFVLVRRLLLVALLVSAEGSDVWVWLTLVNFCLLAGHLKLEPYERGEDNTLETLTLLSLAVQTTLLIVWPPPYLSPAVVAVLSTLIVAPLLPAAVSLLVRLWRFWQFSTATASGSSAVRDDSL